MAVGDLAQLVQLMYLQDFAKSCSFGLEALTASPTWRTELANEWLANVPPVWAARQVIETIYQGIIVNDVVPGGGPGVEVFGDTHPAEGLSVKALPPQCAGVISWRTGVPGRANRGRSYVPALPISYTDVQGSAWTSGGFAALTAMASKVFLMYGTPVRTSLVARLVVISRQLDGEPRGPIGVPVTSFRINSYVRTQRQRVRRFRL